MRYTHQSSLRPCHAARMLGRLVLPVLLVLGLGACAATTEAPLTEEQRVAHAMRERGVKIENLRIIAVSGRKGERIQENHGFDIPGIKTQAEPAGTIRIYKDERSAQTDQRLYGLLGAPGPATKLDYVTVNGKRELILDDQVPNDLAQQYITAFTSSP